MRRMLCLLTLGFLTAAISNPCWGQFGTSSTGSSRTATSGSTQRGGQNGQSQSGNFGTMSPGTTSAIQPFGTQRNAPVGMRDTTQDLIGTNNLNPGGGNRGTTGRNNRAARQNFNGMDQFGQQNFGNNATNNSTQVRRTVQPQHRVAFDYAVPTGTNMTGKLGKVLAPHPKSKVQIQNLKIDAEGDGVVTLRGEVDSEDHKRLAGLMVQFEPGVRKVQNELVVKQPQSLPPSSGN